ncbi:MAG: hypothetical protein SFV81_19290, partial [Pirellulaceae bacterium]|nr:hypothetical protein [Pirellulaceae bacterium]
VELELKNSYPNVTFLSLHMFLNQRDEDCPTNWRSTLKPYPPEIPDVNWLRRVTLLATLVAVILLIVSPAILQHRRAAHFDAIGKIVARHGGTLSFDLQGDYTLHLEGRFCKW